MVFQPQPNQTLTIDAAPYRVAEHPAAPGMPYGQEGRQAIVYQLFVGDEQRALKVFKPRFRVPALVALAEQLAAHADTPGLRVCARTVLTPQRHNALLREHPDLTYAVLMPWVEGPTWLELLLEQRAITPAQSLALAHALADTLARMEQRGIAHGDLSAPNVLIPALAQSAIPNSPLASRPAPFPIELVDVEGLYAPNLAKPAALPSGSAGYAHKTSAAGLWSADADRFAGTVLIAEMLGWCDARVRAAAWGESYFAPDEMQTDGERYRTLDAVLRERWGARVADLFAQAWHSATLADCATFGELMIALPAPAETPTLVVAPPLAPSRTQVAIAQAQQFEQRGDLVAALDAYRQASATLPTRDPLRAELALIVESLERRQQTQTELAQLSAQAEMFEQENKWQAATHAYRELLARAPNAANAARWQIALRQCESQAELAQLFDNGAAALQRGNTPAARELLSAVIKREPSFTRNGTRAATLLEQASATPRKARAGIWLAALGVGLAGVIALGIGALIVSQTIAKPVVLPTPIAVGNSFATPTRAASSPTTTPVVPSNSFLTPTRAPALLTPTSTRGVPTITPVAPRAGEERALGGAAMVFIPAGDFAMGSANSDGDANTDEKPQHTVSLDAFWVDKVETTNALYKKCVDAGKCARPQSSSSGIGAYYGNTRYDNYPVVLIAWNDAKNFCEWSGKRLPTEAEWEKAARGTDGRIYPWGNAWSAARLNFCDRNCRFADYRDNATNDNFADLAPVGSFPSGASPYTAFDLAGNVSEWVADWYAENYFSVSPRSNPQGPAGGQDRAVRGGAWDSGRTGVRAANRERTAAPGERNESIGFRCAMSAR